MIIRACQGLDLRRRRSAVTLIELTFLNGRQRLGSYPYYACIQY